MVESILRGIDGRGHLKPYWSLLEEELYRKIYGKKYKRRIYRFFLYLIMIYSLFIFKRLFKSSYDEELICNLLEFIQILNLKHLNLKDYINLL